MVIFPAVNSRRMEVLNIVRGNVLAELVKGKMQFVTFGNRFEVFLNLDHLVKTT